MKIKYINEIESFDINKIDIDNFNNLSQIYSFTTENIAGYFEHLDFIDKNVLTVCGSGDHIINSFYCGAKNVVGFDINYLALIFTELKLVALQHLQYKEFMQFFMINDYSDKEKNKKVLDYNIYKQLKKYISKNAAKCWDMIYEHFENDGYKIRNSYMFNNKYDNNEIKINSNIYLKDEETYNEAKRRICGKEVTLLNSNYRDIKLTDLICYNEYNIILMSNISDYIKSLYNMTSNYLEEYIKEIIEKFKMKDNEIVCAYLYDIENSNYRTEIDNPEIRNLVFNKCNIEYVQKNFKSVIEDREDSIIII